MKISFIDKFGETVFIENESDFANMIEKYIGGTARFSLDTLYKGYVVVEDSEGTYDDGYEACRKEILNYIECM